jgi:hypothetical protein
MPTWRGLRCGSRVLKCRQLETLTRREQASYLRCVPLFADLEDLLTGHGSHGLLTGDASEPGPSGYLVTLACRCRVVFIRWVTPEDVAEELATLPFGQLAPLDSGMPRNAEISAPFAP